MPEPINIVNLSGGKDSSAMLLMMRQRGIPVHKVLFADVGMPAEFPSMYDYLKRVEAYTGIPVTTVRSEKHTVTSIFYGYPSRGVHKDEIRGFPPTVGAGCRYRSWLKVEPLEAASGAGNHVYIGIAADEAGRSRSMEYAKGKNTYHFPLVDWGVTEQQCLDYLRERDLYNELYDYFDRLGCFWCPKQPLKSLKKLWSAFPDLWEELRQMERDQGRPFKHKYPAEVLDVRFRKELAEELAQRDWLPHKKRSVFMILEWLKITFRNAVERQKTLLAYANWDVAGLVPGLDSPEHIAYTKYIAWLRQDELTETMQALQAMERGGISFFCYCARYLWCMAKERFHTGFIVARANLQVWGVRLHIWASRRRRNAQ